MLREKLKLNLFKIIDAAGYGAIFFWQLLRLLDYKDGIVYVESPYGNITSFMVMLVICLCALSGMCITVFGSDKLRYISGNIFAGGLSLVILISIILCFIHGNYVAFVIVFIYIYILCNILLNGHRLSIKIKTDRYFNQKGEDE